MGIPSANLFSCSLRQVNMYISVWYTCEYGFLVATGVGPPGTGITGGRKLPDVDARN